MEATHQINQYPLCKQKYQEISRTTVSFLSYQKCSNTIQDKTRQNTIRFNTIHVILKHVQCSGWGSRINTNQAQTSKHAKKTVMRLQVNFQCVSTRKYIFSWWIIHCHISFGGGGKWHDPACTLEVQDKTKEWSLGWSMSRIPYYQWAKFGLWTCG